MYYNKSLENNMQSYLNDLVKHTHALGNISFIKVTGTEDGTSFDAVSDDKTVIVQGKFANPIAEFIGVFGMPNLDKLNVILSIPEYADSANVTIETQEKNGTTVPYGLHFVNSTGDFHNDYRFMPTELVNEKLKTVKFKGVNWDITITPSVSSIQRFKFQSQANSESPLFLPKVEKNNLVFYFGEVSTLAGNFVFESGVSGNISRGWEWPVKPVIDILNSLGDKTMKISNEGALQIVVNSGVAEYTYTLPAMTK
jgi:hypothetical protein